MWKQHGPRRPNVTAADTLLVGFPHVNLPPSSGVAKNPPALQHPAPTTLENRKKSERETMMGLSA